MCTSMNSSFTAAYRFHSGKSVTRTNGASSSPTAMSVKNVPSTVWSSTRLRRPPSHPTAAGTRANRGAARRPANARVRGHRVREHVVRTRPRLGVHLGQQDLRLTAPLEQVQPERRFVDGLPHGQQPVVLEEQRLPRPQRRPVPRRLLGLVDRAGVVVEHCVVAVERARVLARRLDQPTGGRPRAPVDRVRVRDGVDVVPRARWSSEWIANAAAFSGRSPSSTVPSKSTRRRSDSSMSRQLTPSGLAQNRSSCSGSRTVMCPATQWS